MKLFHPLRRSLFFPALLAALIPQKIAAQSNATRKAGDAVNSPTVRKTPGLKPNEHLLFNGWGLTPAGSPVPISDLALKLVVSPDKKMLVAVCGGFSNTGLTLVDLAGRNWRNSSRSSNAGMAWPSARMANGFSPPAATRGICMCSLTPTARRRWTNQ